MMDIKKTVGMRINSALARSGMLQKDLAKILGVTDNTISYYCNGARSPQLEQLPIIAEALNTTTDFLLGVTADPSTKSHAVDALGFSPKVIEWFLELRKSNMIHSVHYDIFENDAFHLLIENLCQYYNTLIAEYIYDDYYNKHFPNRDEDKSSQEKGDALYDDIGNSNAGTLFGVGVASFLHAQREIWHIEEGQSALAAIITGGEGFSASEIADYKSNKWLHATLAEIERLAYQRYVTVSKNTKEAAHGND